ncbi:DUF4412 domain-containing protein [Patiriisocius hiemis]|uniref:DUF4412 domain-containing protein n=1 Tax=Patiriisocius hiemis TaxID=3075604 RepID=A0ABU2YBR3_9FLAO|nr:DUF4412 domain-containing protein [Constantimarinum sp. W242]MDT0555197.1 DUF4412 domain-containing protein [Constantimarinum sp. W242]
MKKRYLIPMLLCVLFAIPKAEAQIFKKIKEKINQVTGGEQTEDTNNQGTIDTTVTNTPTAEERQATEIKIGDFFGGGLEGVPDTYKFSYRLTYALTSGKDSNALQYLLEPDTAYFGNKMDNPDANQIVVYDLKKNMMVTYMDNNGQKMAIKMRMPNLKKTEKKFGKKIIPENNENVDIIPIQGKTILGYQCQGYQVTSDEGVAKFWVTNDAPVSLNGIYANFSSLPKKTKDQELPLDENSLVLEITYESRKKKKENMHMVCTELKEQLVVLHKKDYNSGM